MSYRTYVETRLVEIVANIVICLIHQTNYLLDQQIRRLEQAFVTEGGLRERMTRACLRAATPESRNRTRLFAQWPSQTDGAIPSATLRH